MAGKRIAATAGTGVFARPAAATLWAGGAGRSRRGGAPVGGGGRRELRLRQPARHGARRGRRAGADPGPRAGRGDGGGRTLPPRRVLNRARTRPAPRVSGSSTRNRVQ